MAGHFAFFVGGEGEGAGGGGGEGEGGEVGGRFRLVLGRVGGGCGGGGGGGDGLSVGVGVHVHGGRIVGCVGLVGGGGVCTGSRVGGFRGFTFRRSLFGGGLAIVFCGFPMRSFPLRFIRRFITILYPGLHFLG